MLQPDAFGSVVCCFRWCGQCKLRWCQPSVRVHTISLLRRGGCSRKRHRIMLCIVLENEKSTLFNTELIVIVVRKTAGCFSVAGENMRRKTCKNDRRVFHGDLRLFHSQGKKLLWVGGVQTTTVVRCFTQPVWQGYVQVGGVLHQLSVPDEQIFGQNGCRTKKSWCIFAIRKLEIHMLRANLQSSVLNFRTMARLSLKQEHPEPSRRHSRSGTHWF